VRPRAGVAITVLCRPKGPARHARPNVLGGPSPEHQVSAVSCR
jgi:hypothetical protein